MTEHSPQLNYDILSEIFRHFSIAKPFITASGRHHRYWGPCPIDSLVLDCKRDALEVDEKRKTLINAALVCKAFADVALNELWAAPRGGLYAVLNLLSATIVKKEVRASQEYGDYANYEVDSYTLSGDIDAQEWASLQRYAARIRELAYHNHSDSSIPYYIDPAVFDALFERTNGQPLFPNLRLLAWQRTQDASENGHQSSSRDRLLALLVPPTLSVVVLWHPHEEPWDRLVRLCPPLTGVPKDIGIIAARAPHIRHIKCGLEYACEDFKPLHNCHHLCSIEMTEAPVDISFFKYFLKLPELRRLRVSLNWTMPITKSLPFVVRDEQSSRWFPALEELELHNADADRVAQVLRLIPPQSPLSSISLGCLRDDDHQLTGDPALLSTISPLIGFARTLRIIRLDIFYSILPQEIPLDFVQFAEPLLSLHEIEEVSLSVSSRFVSLTVQHLTLMASAWPRLSLFKFRSQAITLLAATPGPVPSILGVVDFARRCPRLEELVMVVADISEEELRVLEERVAGSTPSPEPTLARFCPLPSSRDPFACSDGARLARALHRLFPRLEGDKMERLRDLSGPKEREWVPWGQCYDKTSAISRFLSELEDLQALRHSASRN